jgi:orotate phosphoribosyltransferase
MVAAAVVEGVVEPAYLSGHVGADVDRRVEASALEHTEVAVAVGEQMVCVRQLVGRVAVEEAHVVSGVQGRLGDCVTGEASATDDQDPHAARVGHMDAALARDIDARCRLTGEFTLRSGQVATEYFDKYLFETDPDLLARVATAMVALLPDGTELLGGLEMGGIPIVTVVSAQSRIPALFVRKVAKSYGTCKLAEGPGVVGRRVTLIEDVITTGGAVRNAALALRDAGATVETVVCAIDRSPVDDDPLADVGLEIRSVLTKADLDAVHT